MGSREPIADPSSRSVDGGRLPPATAMPHRPPGARFWVIVALLLAGGWAADRLDLATTGMTSGEGGRRVAQTFFARALTPALGYEGRDVPAGTEPLLVKAARAAGTTVVFAAAAMSLALAVGLVLGFFATSAWWLDDPAGGEGRWRRWLRRSVAPLVWGGCRLSIALMRSVHELLWAVLLLAAFGLTRTSAVIAIAIPYAGTLAKVFSELIDEAPRDAAEALRGAGASPLRVFCFGLLPRAAPDLGAYAFYRFECALRSSAILGFFGYPTLGYYLATSFENLHYGEVWTYLYTLFLLVAAVDWWSGALRARGVA